MKRTVWFASGVMSSSAGESSIQPWAMVLTVIPCAAHSCASARVRLRMPPCAAQYAAALARPRSPRTDATLMIRPRARDDGSFFSISLPAARQAKKVALRLPPMTFAHSASLVFVAGLPRNRLGAFTSTSMRPSSFATCRTITCAPWPDDASVARSIAVRPSSRTSRAVLRNANASSASVVAAQTAMSAPASARASAMARPAPEAAPSTSACLPDRS